VETAQTMMDGPRIYYSFIRPHTALNGKTPAQKASIETDRAEWMSLIKKASQHRKGFVKLSVDMSPCEKSVDESEKKKGDIFVGSHLGFETD
jgi:hypothetical protein